MTLGAKPLAHFDDSPRIAAGDLFCHERYLRINPSEICFVKFILEGYDGLAVLSTVDAVRGVVRLAVAPGREQELEPLIGFLSETILMEPVAGTIPAS